MKFRAIHHLTLIAAMLSVGTLACSKDKKNDDNAAEESDSSDDEKKKKKKKSSAAKTAEVAAHTHLAKNCDVAAYIDIGQLNQAAPVKKHLVPVWEKLKAQKPKDDDEKAMRAAMEEIGINDPLKDIASTAVCVSNINLDGQDADFALIVAGKLKKASVVPAILKHATKKEKFTEVDVAGTKALSDPEGELFMGQASDGVFVLAKGKSAFEAALPASNGAKGLKLPVDHALSMVIPAKIVTKAVEQDPDNPMGVHAKSLKHIITTINLKATTAEVRFAMSDDKTAAELSIDSSTTNFGLPK